MKKNVLSLSVFSLALAFVFSGCTKDEDKPEEPPATGTTGSGPGGQFSWSVNNSSTTVIADSAVYFPKFTTIFAYKGGTVTTVEINLSDIIVGTYSLSSVTGNELTYETNGATFKSTSGVVKIANNVSGKLTGDFNCALTGGSAVSSISGQFSDIQNR
jgi:hypothetical protein